MKKTLLVVAAVLLCTTALALGALFTGTSLGFATPFLERQASAALGRDVHIGEAPTVRLGRSLTLSGGALRLANAEWAGRTDLATIKRIDLRLHTSSLFDDGPILVEEMTLAGGRLALALDAEGNSNLPDLGSPEEEPDDEAREDRRAPIVFDRVSIRDVEITRSRAGDDTTLVLRVDTLEQRAIATQELELRAEGTLQDKAWSLRGRGSRLDSLLQGKDMYAQLEGELSSLALKGSYSLADVNAPGDLTLYATVTGSVPPRIAELSPLFEADTPMALTVDVRDVDPGINIDLMLELETLDLHISGTADRPETGDGLELDFDIDASSLPRLARALRLGATEEIDLEVSASLARNGRELRVPRFAVRAGEHRLRGTMNFPDFPRTTDGELIFNATGPEFAFYQRLFERPVSLDVPYTITAQLTKVPSGNELLDAQLQLGSSQLRVEGSLGAAPGYHGSDLQVQAGFRDLAAIGALVDTSLPAIPAQLEAEFTVDANGKVQIAALQAEVAEAIVTVNGSLQTYPRLDELQLTLEAQAPSLAVTAAQWGIEGLGDVPAELQLSAEGSVGRLEISDAVVRAGGLEASRSAGSLQVTNGRITTDMELDVTIRELPELLGAYANEAMSGDTYQFTFTPKLLPGVLGADLHNLSGPGIQGDAEVLLPRDLAWNEEARVSADLEIANLATLVPGLEGYTPPAEALRVQASTRGGAAPLIDARIRGGDADLLVVRVQTRAAESDPLLINLTGSGDDLHRLGALDVMPPRLLPYEIDADVTLENDRLGLVVRNLIVDNSQLLGTARFDREERSLRADVSVPQANLQPWIGGVENREEPQANVKGDAKTRKNRKLIPETTLRLGWLHDYTADIQLQTGALGIPDPFFADMQLVDTLQLAWRSGNGRGQLALKDSRGSRGAAAGRVDLTAADDRVEMDLLLGLRDFPVGVTSDGPDLRTLPSHDLDMTLRGGGATVRELAASLNGEVLMTGGAGVLKDMGISFATESFFAQLLTALLPTISTRQTDMEVECTIVAARINSGTVVMDPGFVMRTGRVDLSARGQIDLASEKLAIRFDNQARKGLGISAASLVNPYVQITGTLANPKLGLDVAGSAIAGGAAVATGGLTVIAKPLFGRFLRRKSPCELALNRWEDTAPG